MPIINTTEPIRLPNFKQRIANIGRTGSGKTVAGTWHLSNANFDSMPWTIVDFKRDDLFSQIEKARYSSIDAKPPKEPGIYILQPEPEEPKLLDYLTAIWRNGNHGVFIDEGFMMGEDKKVERRFKTLLTQGRSLRIPMIINSQRPSWISRFVFSEADFFQVFHLNDIRDQKTVEDFIPAGAFKRLPDFHSIYFDVGDNTLTYLSPVPSEDEIIGKINARLKSVRKRL